MGRMVRNKFYKHLIFLITCVISMGGLFSCSSETLNSPQVQGDENINFNFKMVTRGANSNFTENTIDNILIFVFTEDVLTDIYEYKVTLNTKLLFDLNACANKIAIHFLANTSLAKKNLGHVYGTHEKDFIHALPHYEAKLTYDLIPMWGSILLPNGIKATGKDETHNHSVQLLRAFSKVEIRQSKEITEDVFKINSIRVYRSKDIVLVPNAEAIHEKDFRVQEPTLPILHEEPDESVVEVPLEIENPSLPCSFYLSESKGYLKTNPSWVYKPTCIIVGGFYKGATNETFYRIDSNKDLPKKPNEKTEKEQPILVDEYLRNHFYGFCINKISGPGCEDPDLAASQDGCGTKLEVAGWVPVEWEVPSLGVATFGAYSVNDWVLAQSSLELGVAASQARPWIPKEWEDDLGEGDSFAIPWKVYKWDGFYGAGKFDIVEPWKHITKLVHDGMGNDVDEDEKDNEQKETKETK